jgi:transcriptional accessory protein Tex/SPT6
VVQAAAIGNGTASRETQEFFASLNRESKSGLKYTVVSEAGASVYSASKLGQEEYPNLDVTVRGAVSIAQRLRDPMAELIKIDPKSLGIGQYQHDVDIGLKNDGLIHISKLSTQRISHPMEVLLSVNQYLPRIRVLTVDANKGRVSLSIKDTFLALSA